MAELYLSDLHIGHEPDGRLDSLSGFLGRHNISKIVIHGDALHLNEEPLTRIQKTHDWQTLNSIAANVPVNIIPGNHDLNLEKMPGGRIGNCRIVSAFIDEWGYWHSHWHEFDPIFNVSRWWYLTITRFFKRTPYQLLQPKAGNPVYLSACQVIHTSLINRRKYNGYIGGHTHLPMKMSMPDLNLVLWNCGDLVDSNSGIINTGGCLELIFFDQ